MAGQPHAKIFLSSSPMGKLDAHAKAFDDGETAFQVTAMAPTWIARPALTQDECRLLEPDPDTFQREYGAIPFDGSTLSLFSEAMLAAITREGPAILPPVSGVTYFAAQDPATRANEWSLAVARVTDSGSIQVVCVRGWRAPKGGALDTSATMAEIAGVLHRYGIYELWQDQWSYDALKSVAAKYGISLMQEPMTQAGKVQMFDALKRRATDGTLEIPDDAVVRSDLLGVRKWISKGGAFSVELERQGGRHSDHAQSIALVTSKAGDGVDWRGAMVRLARNHGGRFFDQHQAWSGARFFGPPTRPEDEKPPLPRVVTTHLEGQRFELVGTGTGALPADRALIDISCAAIGFHPAAGAAFREIVELMVRTSDYTKHQYDPAPPAADQHAA
jgi:hypothetical protein